MATSPNSFFINWFKLENTEILTGVNIFTNATEHDYQTKLKKICEFLEKGNQVRIAVEFRGREMQYKNLGSELLDRVIADAGDLCKTNTPFTFAGRRISTNLSPAKN